MTHLAARLNSALRKALDIHGYFSNEDGRACEEDKIDLQTALVEQLGSTDCERELAARFSAAAMPPPDPPTHMGSAKDVCASRGRSRRVDILWSVGNESVAVELKLRRITGWDGTYENGEVLVPRKTVDTYGYFFLKDLHRLERLESVATRSGERAPDRRFAMFLSNDPYEFEGRVPHDNLALSELTLSPGQLVQFNLVNKVTGRPTSENTLWRDYPPFCLSGAYDIAWTELHDDVTRFRPSPTTGFEYPPSRLLLLEVLRQQTI